MGVCVSRAGFPSHDSGSGVSGGVHPPFLGTTWDVFPTPAPRGPGEAQRKGDWLWWGAEACGGGWPRTPPHPSALIQVP